MNTGSIVFKIENFVEKEVDVVVSEVEELYSEFASNLSKLGHKVVGTYEHVLGKHNVEVPAIVSSSVGVVPVVTTVTSSVTGSV
jgi:hypothetical protein